MNDSRLAILTFWEELENTHGDTESQEKIQARRPILTRQPVKDVDGNWVEEHVLVFPDDKSSEESAGLKLLKMAHAWKKQKLTSTA